MSLTSQNWGTIHPSALHHAAGFVRPVAATPRLGGAVRYCCPITGSLVLVTDEATLRSPRVRCAGCGELHRLTGEVDSADPEARS